MIKDIGRKVGGQGIFACRIYDGCPPRFFLYINNPVEENENQEADPGANHSPAWGSPDLGNDKPISKDETQNQAKVSQPDEDQDDFFVFCCRHFFNDNTCQQPGKYYKWNVSFYNYSQNRSDRVKKSEKTQA